MLRQDHFTTRPLKAGRTAGWSAAVLAALVLSPIAGGIDATPAPNERAVVLRLASGHEVSGRILADGFDEASGLVMRRDDNGGRLTLRWDQIHPDDVDVVKRMYGFVGDELPTILIDVLEIDTTSGQSVSGINRGMKDGKLQLEKGGVIYPVPTSMIRRQRTIKVPALDFADPLEVFVQKRQEAQPTEAVDWFNLALLAESLNLYEQAEECYNETLALDPNFSKKAVIDNNMARLQIKKKEAGATADLAKIANALRQGKYAPALLLCNAFQEAWPTSKQMGDLQKLKNKIVAKRHDSLVSDCRTDYFTFMRDITRQKVREKELTLGEALNWSEDSLSDEVIERLATYYKTTTEEVEQVWGERGLGGSPHAFSYGGGTWLLGQAATEGMGKKKTEEDAGPVAQGGGTPGGAKTIEEKIAAKLKEKAEKNKKSKKGARSTDGPQIYDVPPTEEDWWLAAGPSERQAFLIAWYAEKTGSVNVVDVSGRSCSTCQGKGILKYWANSLQSKEEGSGKKRDWDPCPRCKGLGFDRLVNVR